MRKTLDNLITKTKRTLLYKSAFEVYGAVMLLEKEWNLQKIKKYILRRFLIKYPPLR